MVEIDVVGIESTKRIFASTSNVVGLRAKVRVVNGHAELGRHNHVGPSSAQGLAKKYFRFGTTVDIGGVKEVDARLNGCVDDVFGFLGVDTHAEVVATEAHGGDFERA